MMKEQRSTASNFNMAFKNIKLIATPKEEENNPRPKSNANHYPAGP
jgi:hypothetical protein